MSSFKSIGRNSIFLVSSQITEKILYLLMVILLARFLGKADYGRLIYALSFANLFTFFWDFGLGRLITRDVAANRSMASTIFSSKVKFQVLSCLAGILVLSFYLLLFEGKTLEAFLIFILGISTAFNYLSNSFRSVFIAFEKAEYETFFNVILRSGLLVAIFLTTHAGLGLIWISIVLLFFSLLNLSGSWVLVEKIFFRLAFRERVVSFWSTIRDSFPIALTIAFATFYLQINKILLLKWKGAEATGIYGAVEMIVMTLMIISNSLVLATFPVISRENRISKEKTFPIYKSVFKFLITLGLPVALGGMLLNKEIISLIYGAEFSESKEVLKILIWVTPIVFLTNFTGSCLVAIDKQKLLAYIYGFNTLLNLALNLVLIPYYGYIGAAIAFLATEGVNLIIQYRVLKQHWEESVFDASFLKICLSLGLMGFFIYWFQRWNVFIVLFGAIVIYFVSLLTSGFYSKIEIYKIKAWISQE
jgi:O-antigen/teichoic acid export membrane protein